MNRIVLTGAVAAALTAAIGVGFTGGRVLHEAGAISITTAAASETASAPI
jgi:hypothetical protein